MKRHIITIVASSIVLIVLGFFTLGQGAKAVQPMFLHNLHCVISADGRHTHAHGFIKDSNENGISGVSVTLSLTGANTKSDTTDQTGLFVMKRVSLAFRNSNLSVNATKTDFVFVKTEGTSQCNEVSCEGEPHGNSCPIKGVGGIAELPSVL